MREVIFADKHNFDLAHTLARKADYKIESDPGRLSISFNNKIIAELYNLINSSNMFIYLYPTLDLDTDHWLITSKEKPDLEKAIRRWNNFISPSFGYYALESPGLNESTSSLGTEIVTR